MFFPIACFSSSVRATNLILLISPPFSHYDICVSLQAADSPHTSFFVRAIAKLKLLAVLEHLLVSPPKFALWTYSTLLVCYLFSSVTSIVTSLFTLLFIFLFSMNIHGRMIGKMCYDSMSFPSLFLEGKDY